MISNEPRMSSLIQELRSLLTEMGEIAHKQLSSRQWLPPLECLDVFVTDDKDEYYRTAATSEAYEHALTSLGLCIIHNPRFRELSRLKDLIMLYHNRPVWFDIIVRMTDEQFLAGLGIRSD